MKNIHDTCVKNGTGEDGYINYVKGANVAGFLKVANSMLDQGIL
jgi:glutamate dehydrogenase (NADP+)